VRFAQGTYDAAIAVNLRAVCKQVLGEAWEPNYAKYEQGAWQLFCRDPEYRCYIRVVVS